MCLQHINVFNEPAFARNPEGQLYGAVIRKALKAGSGRTSIDHYCSQYFPAMSHTVTLTREDLMLDLEKQQCFNTAESNDVIITVDTSSRATTAVSAGTNNGRKIQVLRKVLC